MRKIKIAAAAIFVMMLTFLPTLVSSAASCGDTVSQNTAAALKAVDYNTDEKIAALLALSHYSMVDKLNKKTEIAKRDGKTVAQVSDEEAIKELNQDNVQIQSYGEAFADVQAEIGQIIQRLVDGTVDAQEKGAAFFTEKILEKKEELLLGLSYLERLYNFNMGDQNIKDILIYAPDTYGVQVDALDWLIKIGSAGGDTLKLSNSANVFGWRGLFSNITSSMTLNAFLEENRQKWIPDTSMNDWFLEASHACITEKMSSWDEKADIGLYNRLYEDSSFRSYILPLLTVSEDSVYVIANSATITFGIVDCYVDRELRDTDSVRYEEKREQFRQQLEQMATQQRDFIDLWYRIAKPEVRGQLSSNRVVLDSLRIYADSTVSASAEWSARFGKDASRGVREFFTPLNLYDSFFFSDGMADGTGVRYYLSKALTERGLATYAHELTHLLVSPVMLNGYGARDGMQAEVYTRGMFEPYELNDPPVFNLNLIYDRLAKSDRLHNALPGRFQEEKDLQDYMSGILDVIYTLDYTEADIMLAKTPDEKKKWFHKLEQIEDTKTRSNQGDEGSKHNLDSVRELTLAEAKELNTIDDLIRDSIIVSRYEVNGTQTTGTMASNGYYVVPLFSANYAGVQNDAGVSGDVMIRRQAFELLAEYGYYDGMVPYISNQYREAARSEQAVLSDTYILKKIFGDAYGTMAEFKKAMFQKRIEKVNELKPVTIIWGNQSVTINNFEMLRQLMKEAVESDLKNVTSTANGSNNIRAQDTQVERLKAEIFRAYLFQTDDFKETIYRDGQEPVEPSPVPTPAPSVPSVTIPPVPPTEVPTAAPTEIPTAVPTVIPTATPVITSSASPAPEPSAIPSFFPTEVPTIVPTAAPTAVPTVMPTATPVTTPTASPVTISQNKSSFQPPALLLARVSSARTSQTIRWNPVKSADGYYIYGAKSNKKYKRLRTIRKNNCKWKHTKLKKGTSYKYYIAAYKRIGGRRVILCRSLSVYGTTKGGTYGNPAKIRAQKSAVSVKLKKTVRLKIKITGRKLKKASKKIRYISTNPSVVKVSKRGIVTGVRRGTCSLYCIARNGLSKKVRIRVK